MKNKNLVLKGIIIFLIVLLIISLVTISSYAYMLLSDKNIAKGVSINGIDVGEMSKQNAENTLKEYYEPKINKNVVLKWDDKSETVNLSKLGVSYDYDKAVNEAYMIGKGKHVINDLKSILNAKSNGYDITLERNVKAAAVDSILKSIQSSVNKPAKDAQLEYKSGNFVILPDSNGEQFVYDKSKQLLLDRIKNDDGSDTINLYTQTVKPKYNQEYFKKVNTKVASYKTYFNTSDANRSYNLKIGAEAVNGTVLMPGQAFSLNKTLGPRVADNGYKTAHVIQDGKLIDDYGGGVCQIATTVYNAAVKAQMKITSRDHHEFPVTYVAPGLDATISGDWLDLKFVNTSNYPIVITSYIIDNSFNVDIYGFNYMPGVDVELDSKIVKINPAKTEYKNDSSLAYGQEVVDRDAHDGLVVDVYKKVYKNDKLVSNEKIYTDNYDTINAIVRKGTKK